MGPVELVVKLVLGQSAASSRIPFYARVLPQSASRFLGNSSVPSCPSGPHPTPASAPTGGALPYSLCVNHLPLSPLAPGMGPPSTSLMAHQLPSPLPPRGMGLGSEQMLFMD